MQFHTQLPQIKEGNVPDEVLEWTMTNLNQRSGHSGHRA